MRNFFRLIWKIITAPFRFIARIIRGIYSAFRRAAQSIHAFFTEEESDDTPIGDSLATTIENPKALLPHLYALRKHLLRAVLAIVITTSISFMFVQNILVFLAEPMAGGIDELIAIDVTENIGTVMRVTLLVFFILAFPYVIF